MKRNILTDADLYRVGSPYRTEEIEGQLCIVSARDADINHTEIIRYLTALGILGNYKGFFYLSYAVELSLQEPERMAMITKWIYPDVAKRFQTTPACVERNIRQAIRKSRENNAGDCNKQSIPTNSQFLAEIVAHFTQMPQAYAK